MLKKLNPQTKKREDLKEKILDDLAERFNELYYGIMIMFYYDEKIGLTMKDRKRFDYKNLRLADDYEYESEEQEEKTN